MTTADQIDQLTQAAIVLVFAMAVIGATNLVPWELFVGRRVQARIEWAGLVFATGAVAYAISQPALRLLAEPMTPIGVTIVGVMFATMLYAMRRWRKDLYGLLEVFVAVATLAAVGSQQLGADLVPSLVGFVGAVYVLVRGLVNFTEGRAERR